jgi:hypothetical protein
MNNRKEYDAARYVANKELRKAQFRVQYLKNRKAISDKYFADKLKKEEEMRTKNEENMLSTEGDNLSTYLVANAVKLVKALDAERYEECTELRLEKNQYVYNYVQLMGLYRDINELECIQELDAMYGFLIDKCKEEFVNAK